MVMSESDCIFCKIAKKELSSMMIYENEYVIAFLDIAPVSKGHALVVPKRHSETLLLMDDRDVAETFKAVRNVSEAIMKALGAKGFNIKMNNFKIAGQVVPHAHIHIIPRYEDDGLKDWSGQKADNKELHDVAKEIMKKF